MVRLFGCGTPSLGPSLRTVPPQGRLVRLKIVIPNRPRGTRYSQSIVMTEPSDSSSVRERWLVLANKTLWRRSTRHHAPEGYART